MWLAKRIQSDYIVFGQGRSFSFTCKLCCFGRQVKVLAGGGGGEGLTRKMIFFLAQGKRSRSKCIWHPPRNFVGPFCSMFCWKLVLDQIFIQHVVIK